MSTATGATSTRVDQFFTGAEARFDRWRKLLDAARAWESAQADAAEKSKAAVAAGLEELSQWEDFFAYPGVRLLQLLRDRIKSGDAKGTVRLVQTISGSLLTHSYRTNLSDWDGDEEGPSNLGERLPGEDVIHRPYFEALFVTPARQTAWPELAQEFRKLRRSQDKFIYEPVFLGTFEDAILGVILNGSVESVVIYDGIAFESAHNSPVLRQFLKTTLTAAGIDTQSRQQGLTLAQAIKAIRPELDIFVLSDREFEKTAGDPAAACVRRVFYQVEEPLELHLSIFDGIADRFSTSYFDNF